jgi:S-adenosylmethionine:tRNA ribosyltransferase-isomerase
VLLEELDFHIPEELIAQAPVEPRDSCRVMFLPGGGGCRHEVFSGLPELLRAGDTLVFNDSRVLPARVHVRKPSGGSVELLFLRRLSDGGSDGGEAADPSAVACMPVDGAPCVAAQAERWEVLARPSNRLKCGGELTGPGGERLHLRSLLGEGRWIVEGSAGGSLLDMMEEWGLMPLPPYIKTYPSEPSSYQTVYASAPGSAAAPTAGLHFTPALLDRLKQAGIGAAYVTLHVGLDTFQPIREATVEHHRIHRETYSVRSGALETIRAARRAGNRLVAVGTTATRVLETVAQSGALDDPPASGTGVSGSTQIFITPGYAFRAVDALLTNFHLPRSSVLALTMAFAGRERLLEAYTEAIRVGYRFFSFGDAMLIEPAASSLCERPRHGGDHAHA